MTAAGMAAFEARAGKGIVRAFANAVADFGNGLVIEAVFSDPANSTLLGALAPTVREPTLGLLEADLGGVELARGDHVTITRGAVVKEYRLVSQPTNVELGMLEVGLEVDEAA